MRIPIRLIPYVLVTTLVYATFVLLNILSLPVWINIHTHSATQLVHNSINPCASWNDIKSTTGQCLTQLARSVSIFVQSLPHGDLRGMHQTLSSNLYGTPIGGAWFEYSVAPDGLNLTLSDNIIFTQGDPKHAAILPSSSNGYLNSRIDLRRRKRAFDEQSINPLPRPSVSLHLRDDAMFQPRNIDSAVLVSQLHEAIKRNQNIEREKNARKLRKTKKKKGSSKKKSS